MMRIMATCSTLTTPRARANIFQSVNILQGSTLASVNTNFSILAKLNPETGEVEQGGNRRGEAGRKQKREIQSLTLYYCIITEIQNTKCYPV